MEKRDLILDGQQRMEQSLAIQQELDLLRAKLDKVRQRGLCCVEGGGI